MRLFLRLCWLLFRTQFLARLPSAQENLAIQACFPPSGTATSVTSCTTVNGSPCVSTSDTTDAANVTPGMAISGTGIPSSTVIVAVEEISSTYYFLLNKAATASGTVTLTVAATSWYLALFTSDPGTSGSSGEVSGGSYARQAITFGLPSAGSEASLQAQTFTNMPSESSVGYIGVFNASSSGTYEGGGQLSSALNVPAGATVSFALGAVTAAIS